MSRPPGDQRPWEWPEPVWRGIVGRVRAGARLAPGSWPRGASCAVALSFDSDHESSELREGGRSIGRLSWGEYGSRVGVPRILKALAAADARASFFVPAVVALLHPQEQQAIVAAGHEIGLHGWIHELNAELPAETERDLLLRSAEVLERITGVRPVGMRTPSWDFSPSTLPIAVEAGLSYDSSLMADDDCYELLLDGEPTGIIELPIEWIRDDAAYLMMNRGSTLRPYISPADVFDIFRREFEAACKAGGLFQITFHPHVIGYRSRIWILEELLRLARSHNAWFATHAEVVAWVRQASG